ncbi:hypothetical protein EC968_001593 [Mortierella alpina]|nr:hypothetical protein EC968_001593 [Mortierella alpina]
MLTSNPMARLVSLANATKLLRAMPKRTFASSPSASNIRAAGLFPHSSKQPVAASPLSHHQEAVAARFKLGGQQPLSSRFFSSSSATSARPSLATPASSPFAKPHKTATSPFVQGQAVRGFSRKAWRAEHEAHFQAAREALHSHTSMMNDHHKHMHDAWRRCGHRGYHFHHHMRRRRPARFLFRMMVLSTVLVAVPAVMIFDAPSKTLALVPLTVAGVGGALMLTGRLLYVALPIMAVGGAAVFWCTTMPAANTVKDLKKILERDAKGGRYNSTALSALGSNWEIQSAKNDEWFRWTFPEMGDSKSLDKVDIRMAVFDPNDHSDRKYKAMKFLDKLYDEDDVEGRRRRLKHCKMNKRGGDDQSCSIEAFDLKREGEHLTVHMEVDGETLMDQKWAKKYLALGQIVDRAAKEIEAAHPGMRLGDQVVLVHKKNTDNDSCWSRWSPYGDLSLRIPFDRTWVNDLSEM